MRFEFATATRIIFGKGCVVDLPGFAREHGRRVLVVTGRNVSRLQSILDGLRQSHLQITLFAVSEEPTVALAQSGAELVRSAKCDCVISIGGGSVIDAGKAIAALTTNSGDALEYLEVIGKA